MIPEIALAVVLLLIILLLVYLRREYTTFPNYLAYYPNWSDGKTPYVLRKEGNKLRISYYDSQGYFKGFSTFLMDYTQNGTMLTLPSGEILVNYSQIPPKFPWSLQEVPGGLIFNKNGQQIFLQIV